MNADQIILAIIGALYMAMAVAWCIECRRDIAEARRLIFGPRDAGDSLPCQSKVPADPGSGNLAFSPQPLAFPPPVPPCPRPELN